MNPELLADWELVIDERIARKSNRRILKNFVASILEIDLPVIFETSHLAHHLQIASIDLNKLVDTTADYYRHFEIPKRKGGFREITTPQTILLGIQKWVLKNILEKATISDQTHGFAKRRSIITNAKVHLGQNKVLKLDLKDYFPSIKINRVLQVFKNFGYPPNVCYYLARLCCLNDSLPQGAATSPMLSNIITKRLDKRLAAVSNKIGLRYTRYADDLTFSGDKLDITIKNYLANIIRSEGFEVNDQKTKLITSRNKVFITGISIGSNALKLPKEKRRVLRQQVYYLKKHGIISVFKHRNIVDPMFIERLLGKLSFWAQIEPENEFVKSSISWLRNSKKELSGSSGAVIEN